MGPLMVAVSDILKESVSQPIAQEGQLFIYKTVFLFYNLQTISQSIRKT